MNTDVGVCMYTCFRYVLIVWREDLEIKDWTNSIPEFFREMTDSRVEVV